MYLPEINVEERAEEIARILTEYPLATLVAQTPAGLVANHIPMLRSAPDRLIGHIALANDMHRDLAEGSDVLAVFSAGTAYVSPNWYPTKKVHHKHVPTWNYQAVHISGLIGFRHDEKFKRSVVGRLTRHFEQATSAGRAWRMADAPPDYIDTMLENIVGIEIAVERIVAKSKLSQNRAEEDFDSVVRELDTSGKPDVANAMRRVKTDR